MIQYITPPWQSHIGPVKKLAFWAARNCPHPRPSATLRTLRLESTAPATTDLASIPGDVEFVISCIPSGGIRELLDDCAAKGVHASSSSPAVKKGRSSSPRCCAASAPLAYDCWAQRESGSH